MRSPKPCSGPLRWGGHVQTRRRATATAEPAGSDHLAIAHPRRLLPDLDLGASRRTPPRSGRGPRDRADGRGVRERDLDDSVPRSPTMTPQAMLREIDRGRPKLSRGSGPPRRATRPAGRARESSPWSRGRSAARSRAPAGWRCRRGGGIPAHRSDTPEAPSSPRPAAPSATTTIEKGDLAGVVDEDARRPPRTKVARAPGSCRLRRPGQPTGRSIPHFGP